MKIISGPWMLLLIAASVFHCGGTSVDLPFDDDKKVADLSASDLKEVCSLGMEAVQESYGDSLCALEGLMASFTGKGSCETVRDSCLQETFNTAHCYNSNPQPIQCDITVGEVETCMNDSLAQIDEMPSFSCSTTLEELEAIDPSEFKISLPASCSAVHERCADLQLGLGESDDVEVSSQPQ